MPTAEPNSVIDRIKKLMALADRATNEHEAALASSRMQALLQEHNLTRAEIESRNEGSEQAALPDAPREKLTHERAALYRYQRDLMSTIADNNFCMYWTAKKTKIDAAGRFTRFMPGHAEPVRVKLAKAHVLIGRSENVAATVLMYDYLIDAMNRLLPFGGAERRSTDARLWLAGCAETLCERLQEQRIRREKKEKKTVQTPGIVRLVDLYGTEADLNRDFKRGLEPGTTARERLADEAEKRAVALKETELRASGMDINDAWYVARGLDVPDRTPTQVSPQRRRSYSSGWSRSDDAAWRAERREEQKRSHPSFRAGKQRGRDIGLGGALKESTRKQIDA